MSGARETHDSLPDEGDELGGGDVPPSSAGPRQRVLWADSSPDLRDHVARLLGGSYQVHVVADDEAALQAALVSPPDIILLGAPRPGRYRPAVLERLRSNERTALTPVVLVLRRAEEDAALECLDAGADDYLLEPFSSKALLTRVRSRLTLAKRRQECADKLAEATRELEAFSYSVSHDLRAPLRAIDGFSKALLSEQADRLDDQGRRYLDRIRAGTKRMAQLIDDLLGLSRITRAPMTRQPVDLTSISRKILADLGAREPERSVTKLVAEGLVAQCDARLATVLLESLLGNAWKFTSKLPSARVEVGRAQRDGAPVFFVRDNGVGFSMEYANKLFAPFQRLHPADDFPGTGIGLATAQRVVTRHGGRIWAEAAPSQGATFLFTLGDDV